MTNRPPVSRFFGIALSVQLVVMACLALAPAWAQSEAPPRPRAWLGVTLEPVEPPPEAEETSLDEIASDTEPFPTEGALITGVVKDSPADKAGFRAGDVIVAVEGEPVISPAELIRLVGGSDPGTWVELELIRQRNRRDLSARLAERPEAGMGSIGRRLKRAWVGVKPVEVPDQLREYWGGSKERGVLIGEVEQGSPAELGGLRPGDLVLAVEGYDVASDRELVERTRRGGIGNTIELEVSRQGTLLTIEIDLVEEPPEKSQRAGATDR
ncbi:MAG: PDZ domain-containing protein [Acidobacteriota bacterium]|nr:MAG: PDZ domain-containing protein [Acidobacteriota bacterium]